MNESQLLYFIWGSESFLIDQEIQSLIRQTREESGEEPETLFLEADYLEPLQLLEALDYAPLFSVKRVVIIKRPVWLGKSRKKRSKTEEYLRALEAYLKRPSGDQLVIISGDENPTSLGLEKKLGTGLKILQVKQLEAADLAKWVQRQFVQRGREIKPELARVMAGSGQDMYYLLNLIEKLCLMAPGEPLQMKELEAELDNSEEIRVFKLSDALLRRDVRAAMTAFQQLLEQGESEVLFLYIIVRQFIQMAKVKHYSGESRNNKDIEALTGLKSWAVKNKKEQADRFSWDEIAELFKAFLDADTRMKSTSQEDRMIMEELIVKICAK
ncbi:MAG: DNA polymerase III subunit delta [Syntrophomonadaceae bacterium]